MTNQDCKQKPSQNKKAHERKPCRSKLLEKPEMFQFSSKLNLKKKPKLRSSVFIMNMDKKFKELKPRRADDLVERCYRCQKRHLLGWQYEIDGKTYVICSYCHQYLKKTAMPVYLSYYPWRN